MTFAGALVLFAVIWFLCLYVILPQRIRSQSEAGEVAPGTPASAPEDPKMRRKLIWTTVSAVAVWALVVGVVVSGAITLDDLDVFGSPF